MFGREMIPILLLFLKIVLSSAQAGDNAQQGQLPDGKICLFTCSEWIFKEKVQKFAPSADLLGPGYLSKHKIGFSSNDPNSQSTNDSPMQYQKVWGAVYSVNKDEYDAVLKQSQSEYSVPFASNEDVFVVKYNEMNCLVVDLGIQPGDHPPWRHFNMKIPNTIEDDAYFKRLGQIGVPQDYINGLRNSSLKPQYHPIIPQDYHPRQSDQQPKRSYDQLPAVRVHPNPLQQDDQPINGQIPETHDREIPGLSLPNTSTNTVQPTRQLLPGVANPNSQPHVIQPTTGQIPEIHDHEIPGLSLPHTSTNTVQPNTHQLLPGVANPNSQPQVITDQPEYVRGNTPLTHLQPGPHDVQVTVPKDTDSGIAATTPDQPVVVITPMKLPGSSTVKPVVAQPIDTVQNQSPVVVPGKIGNSNVVVPSNGPILTTHQPKEIDDTVPTIVTGVAHPTTLGTVNPTVTGTPQTPVDDQSYVVITPLKLPQNHPGLNSAPVVGQDYKVQTPLSVQPDDTQQTLVPKTIDNDLTKPKNVPPMLLSGPAVTQQGPNQGSLLTPDTISPPRLPTQAPDLLINPLSQPCDHDVPGSNSGLLTLSPTSDLTPTYQNDSPLFTLNDVPHVDQSTIPVLHPDHTASVVTPGVVNNKPVQQVNGPVSHQITPNTVDVGNKPDLLLTNTAPNHLQLHPDGDHTVHSIPADFGVSKPVPILPAKPMFGFDQLHQPNNDVSHIPSTPDNNPTLVSHQITPNTVDLDQNPDLLQTNTAPNHLQLHPTGDQTVHPIPASFGVSKPAPEVFDKPMFTIDQPCTDQPTPTSYQVNPNTLDHVDNPDLLLTNTGPDNLPHHPMGDQTVHSIPPTFGVTKPAAVVPDKPMFGFDQSNPPPCKIPATFGISSQPPAVQDKPMFSLGGSPSLLQPKHIDDDNSKIPSSTVTPIDTVHQPHATGLLPNLVHDQNTQPAHLVSQPNNVPLTTTGIPSSTTVHQLPNSVADDANPALLTTKPSTIPLATTIPDSLTVQVPHQVVNNDHPVLTSTPGSIPLATTIPDSHTVQVPNQVVTDHPVQLASKPTNVVGSNNIPESSMIQTPNPVVNANPALLTSKPDNIPLATTIPDSHTVQVPNQVVTDHPVQLASKPTNAVGSNNIPESSMIQTPNPVVNKGSPSLTTSKPVQQVPPPTYTPSSFMAPNYTPVSPALGYSFANRYPQYLHNSNYKPPNCYYNPDELIPGFTFGSHIQLY